MRNRKRLQREETKKQQKNAVEDNRETRRRKNTTEGPIAGMLKQRAKHNRIVATFSEST